MPKKTKGRKRPASVKYVVPTVMRGAANLINEHKALQAKHNVLLGEWWDQRAEIDKLKAQVKTLEARVRNVAMS